MRDLRDRPSRWESVRVGITAMAGYWILLALLNPLDDALTVIAIVASLAAFLTWLR